MGILRRTFVMLIVGCIAANAVETFAGGPRVLLTATLTATAAAPAGATGKAKYDQSASRTNFSVEAQNLQRLNGQMASIFVNGSLAGSAPVVLGRIKLELTNQRGGTVPAISVGSRVHLMVGTSKILAGAF